MSSIGSARSNRSSSSHSAHSVRSYVSETSTASSIREEDLSLLLTLLENPKQRELGCSFSESSDFRAEFSRKMVMIDPNAKPPKSRGKWQEETYPLPWTEKRIQERRLYDPDYKVYFPLRPFGYSLKVEDTVIPPYKITKIETRFKHCLILTRDGFVYSIGDAEFGKLGDGYEDSTGTKAPFVRKPVLIMDRAIDIAVGKHHSAIVTDEGNVHTFGYGKYGQLGHSNFENENVPRVVEDFINRDIRITKVACGDHHTICLTDTGLVYGFGNGSQGQLGVLGFLDIKGDLSQTEKAQLKYVPRPRLVEIMRETQQETEEYRRLRTKKTFVEIDGIMCGSDYSAFLAKHGQLWLCGCGMTGVIANGTFVANNYRPTEAQFSVSEKVVEKFVKVDINLEPGKNGEELDVKVDFSFQGKLVQPLIPKFLPYNHEKPSSAASSKSSASRASSSIHWLKYVHPNQFNVDGQNIKLVDVSCGSSHLFCMTVDQRVFAAGLNFNGQLGIGNKTSQCRLFEVTNLLPHALVSEGIKQIICGTNYTIIVNGMGTTFATGRFPGNNEDCTKFVEITSISQRQYRIEKMFSRNPEHIFMLCRKE